jgi:hypothetical protein
MATGWKGDGSDIMEKIELYSRLEHRIEGLHQDEEGSPSYLVKEEKPFKGYARFVDLVKSGRQGLCIARTHPDEVRKRYWVDNAAIYWLTSRVTQEDQITASLAKIEDLIRRFVDENRSPVIILEGVEFLITQNDFKRVLRFLQAINEYVHSNDAFLIIPVDPLTLDQKEISLLAREMDVVEEG